MSRITRLAEQLRPAWLLADGRSRLKASLVLSGYSITSAEAGGQPFQMSLKRHLDSRSRLFPSCAFGRCCGWRLWRRVGFLAFLKRRRFFPGTRLVDDLPA